MGLLRGAWDGSPGVPSVVTHRLKSHTVLSTDRATTKPPQRPVREESRPELTAQRLRGPRREGRAGHLGEGVWGWARAQPKWDWRPDPAGRREQRT